jgi:hypothetical protein
MMVFASGRLLMLIPLHSIMSSFVLFDRIRMTMFALMFKFLLVEMWQSMAHSNFVLIYTIHVESYVYLAMNEPRGSFIIFVV